MNAPLPSALLAASLVLLTGCSQREATAPEPPAPQPAAKKAAPPKPRVNLPKVGTFGVYQLSLPEDYSAVPEAAMSTPQLTRQIWQGPQFQGRPKGTLATVVFADPRAIQEAKRGARQFLVNFSAGFTDSNGVTITERGPTEEVSANGIRLSRFRWSGTSQANQPVSGFAYGAVLESEVVAVITLHLDPATADETARTLEAAIATLKRK